MLSYLFLGLACALMVAGVVVAIMYIHPDDEALRARARRWRRKHPRT